MEARFAIMVPVPHPRSTILFLLAKTPSSIMALVTLREVGRNGNTGRIPRTITASRKLRRTKARTRMDKIETCNQKVRLGMSVLFRLKLDAVYPFLDDSPISHQRSYG